MHNARKQEHFLVVDIGNTTIQLAVGRGRRCLFIRTLRSGLVPKVLRDVIREYLQKIRGNIEEVVVCSVAPAITRQIVPIFQKVVKQKIRLVGRDITVPIKNRYDDPRQVGQDRLVGAYAAVRLYGAPLIVVDLGTAITLDVISRSGEYRGGIIIPGLNLSVQALYQGTALLPHVLVKPPQQVIGRNTQDSILSGIFYGYGAMIDGLIVKLSKKIAARPKIVMTGGHAGLMKKFFQHKVMIEPHLVLKGLCLLQSGTKD